MIFRANFVDGYYLATKVFILKHLFFLTLTSSDSISCMYKIICAEMYGEQIFHDICCY